MFININPVNQFENPLKDRGLRKNPIWVSRGYYHEDTFEYTIPENYRTEFIPKDLEIKNEFGEFKCKLIIDGNKI